LHQKILQNSTISVNYSARPDLPGLLWLARSASSLESLRRQAVPLRLIQPTIRLYLYPPKRGELKLGHYRAIRGTLRVGPMA
jgi:hypothetical protein